jgi:hypothetical protein
MASVSSAVKEIRNVKSMKESGNNENNRKPQHRRRKLGMKISMAK